MGDGIARYSITNIAHEPLAGRDNFNLSLLYRPSRHRIEKGGLRRHTMETNVETAKSGFISLLTGLLGMYLTAAMWIELQDSLGLLVGAPLAAVIIIPMALIFQSKKNEREIGLNGNYDMNESFLTSANNPLATQKGRNPVTFIVLLYALVVLINETAGAGILFN